MPFFLHDNRLEDTTSLTANNTDPSDTALNVKNLIDKRPYTFWQSTTGVTTIFITIDTSSTSAAANAIGIIGHNFKDQSVTLSVQNSSDNFGSISTVFVASTLDYSADNRPYVFEFSSASNRYWRIRLTRSSTGKVKAAAIVLGKKFALTKDVQRTYDQDAHRVFSDAVDSKTLQPLGVNVRGRLRTANIRLNAVKSTWVENTFIPEWDDWMHKSEPAFFVWNETTDSTNAQYMQIVPNESFASPHLENTDYRSLTLKFKGPYISS